MIFEILKTIRKPLAILGLGVICIAGATWVYNYLSFERVVVTSRSADATISIIEMPSDKRNARVLVKKASGGKLTVRVSPGVYSIAAQDKSSASNKTIETQRRKTSRHSLGSPAFKVPEPVTSQPARDPTVTAAGLNYRDVDKGQLFRIQSNNQLSLLLDQPRLQEIKWADINFGVGQDDSGKLYTVNGSSAKSLPLPATRASAESVSYSVSTGRKIYISIGPNIYMGEPNGGFRKIYTTETFTPRLFAADDSVLIINSPPEDSGGEGDPPKLADPYFELVRLGGQTTKKKVSATYASWSPDGGKVLIADYFGTSSLYDKSLHSLGEIPDARITRAAWVNNNSLVYATNGSLWLYDYKNSSSYGLTKPVADGDITSIATSGDVRYVYYLVNRQNHTKLYRVNLDNKAVSDSAQKLDVFLPVKLDDCYLNYVNYSGLPTIIMQAQVDKRDVCKAQTDIELVQDGLPAGGFTYQFGDVSAAH